MNLFTYLKNQLSILDLAREYTTLVKAGQYWRGRCPFHNEKTASFTISPHKDIFYCFGCTTGGDIITLVAKKENCSPLEAAHLLIEKYQINVPEQVLASQGNKKEIDEKKRYFHICQLLAQWCHAALLKNPSVGQYLTRRGINAQSIKTFSIGYFPGGTESINSCLTFMRQHNVLADDLLDAHILVRGKAVFFSPFEERIIFPICDHLGRYCGFGGRIFKEQDTRAKYYNSKESAHFIKGSLLFGLDQAKKEIQKTGIAFLVEGYTDCIAMAQYGYTNTLATLGTACTLEHLSALARYVQKVFVIFDSDKAGHDAIIRLTKLCWQVDMELYVICLPSGDDPASFLAKQNSLQPYIQQAQDIFLFFITSVGADFAAQPLANKLARTRQLLLVISSIEEPLKQSLLLDKAAKTLNLPLQSLTQELSRIRASSQPESKPGQEQQPVSHDLNAPLLEKKIFCSILYNNSYLLNSSARDYFFEYLHEPLSSYLQALYQHCQGKATDFHSFFTTLNEQDQHIISRLMINYEIARSQEEFDQLVVQLQKRNWKSTVSAMKERIAQAVKRGDNTQAERIVKEFLELKQKYYGKITDTE